MFLLLLTSFIIFLRYCSFDFFIFLLFFSNGTLIYMMRNSSKINLQLAKKSVKNRVGWAKQYLGELINRKNNDRDVTPPDEETTQKQGKIKLLSRLKRKSQIDNQAPTVSVTTPGTPVAVKTVRQPSSTLKPMTSEPILVPTSPEKTLESPNASKKKILKNGSPVKELTPLFSTSTADADASMISLAPASRLQINRPEKVISTHSFTS